MHTPTTKTRRTARGYHAARIGLDALSGVVTIAASSSFALLIFHDVRADFVGGLNGRIVFTALCAVVAAYAADGLFGTFFGDLRDRLTEARIEILAEVAKEVRARHAEAAAEMHLADPTTYSRLIALKNDVTKADVRALKAGASPGELS